MTAPVIRGYHQYAGWSVTPESGDFLVWIGSNEGGLTTPSGWTAYSGMDTGGSRVWTRTANGSSLDNPSGASGQWPGAWGAGIAFSNGANTSIDYAAGTWSASGSNFSPVCPPPKANAALTTSDGLHIVAAYQKASGNDYTYWGPQYFQGTNTDLNTPSSYTRQEYTVVNYTAYTEDFGGVTWEDYYSAVYTKQLSSTSNPGSTTFTITSPDGANPLWRACSIVVKVAGAGATGPTAYGPSIKR
jgi:hypothetical protein